MMVSHFGQVEKSLNDLETIIEAMFDEVQDIQVVVDTLHVAHLQPSSS